MHAQSTKLSVELSAPPKLWFGYQPLVWLGTRISAPLGEYSEKKKKVFFLTLYHTALDSAQFGFLLCLLRYSKPDLIGTEPCGPHPSHRIEPAFVPSQSLFIRQFVPPHDLKASYFCFPAIHPFLRVQSFTAID